MESSSPQPSPTLPPPLLAASNCPLSKVLDWAASLHQTSTFSTPLTLPQLVPVHQSLLQALVVADADKSVEEPQASEATTTALGGFRPWCVSTAEAQLCESILADPTESPSRHLLVWQYLFFRNAAIASSSDSSRNNNDGAARLWWTLWEFLDRTAHQLTSASSGHEHSDIFLQTVVQVSLASCSPSLGTPEDIQPWIRTPPEDADTRTTTDRYWKRTTLLLVAWASRAKATQSTVVGDIMVSFLERSLQTVWQTASTINTHTSSIWKELSQSAGWKALTQILLPALVDLLGDRNRVEELSLLLWKASWGFWKTHEMVVQEKSTTLVLVVTTVLCPIFPFIAKQVKLPILNSAHNDTPPEPVPLIEQLDVWDFLQGCLRQGMDAMTYQGPKEESSGVPLNRAVSTLIRRRGLYLLRTMTAGKPNLEEWAQYVACFETLEMEEDKHLVSQVWSTVANLMAKAAQNKEPSSTKSPVLSMEWLLLLQGHAITVAELPFLRKENVFRLCGGYTGFRIPDPLRFDNAEENASSVAKTDTSLGVPLSELPLDFVWNVIVPAYDSLELSVGLHVHWTENGKTIRHDVSAAFETFFCRYMQEMIRSTPDRGWIGPWLSSSTMMLLRAKTIAFALQTVANILTEKKESALELSIESKFYAIIADNFTEMFTGGRFLPIFRSTIFESLAAILATIKTKGNINPKGIIDLMSFFPPPRGGEEPEQESWDRCIETDPVFSNLRWWIQGIVAQNQAFSSAVPSALASGFVDGMMTETGEAASWSSGTRRKQEHILSRSIVFFCVMATEGTSLPASQMLWPSINKGLSLAPVVLLNSSDQRAQRVARAAVLLEHGCKVQVLSGNGNGDLVVDRKTNQMMPPPPSIENLLSHAVSYLLHMIRQVLSASSAETFASPKVESRALTARLAGYIETLRTFHRGFPSSSSVSESLKDALELGLEKILGKQQVSIEVVQHLALVYAAFDSGTDIDDGERICKGILNLSLNVRGGDISDGNWNATLSIFEYSRWGAISKLLPAVLASNDSTICQFVLEKAAESVKRCPTEATLPLFECAIITAKSMVQSGEQNNSGDPFSSVLGLKSLIEALIQVMAKHERGKNYTDMLDEASQVLFQPRLLLDEYSLLQQDAHAETPVRSAFRKLVKKAGTKRPHIVRILLSRLVAAWAGRDDIEAGLLAIPYRDDIVDLLTYKEARLEASMISNRDLDSEPDASKIRPPASAHELSLVRSFVLAFLSDLHDVSDEVRANLLNYIILNLAEKIVSGKKDLAMFGSPEHVRIHRGWQALCVLSRFIGEDIAQQVCQKVFQAMEETMHGQTRFFLEVFAIQCTRMHPQIFGKALCHNMTRHDISTQMIASIMIVMGHMTVGRYKSEVMPRKRKASGGMSLSTSPFVLDELLAGAIPWLSSTQGFSRGIAQLMVHALIPLVVDVTTEPVDDTDWYLRSLYHFLEENKEMKRLRKKQTKFFESLDVDLYSTLDGCLSVTVDTVGEAIPSHMIEIIKQTLKDVYKETHGIEAPTWKQVEDIIYKAAEEEANNNDSAATTDGSLNFQRKIIPIDALNLALEDHREKRLRNVAGRRRQPLIVCASLVDKVPNLGGLARTSEIFAADRLVIPDKSVITTDDFTAISVSAKDWIEIEECPQKDLLRWLRTHKSQGWYVLGMEQTSSSVSMTDFVFPNRPTILLLGKERQGIPVEYLQAVDQCVEIPQLGILRSLNVHVTGALAIWEFTRQRMAAQPHAFALSSQTRNVG